MAKTILGTSQAYEMNLYGQANELLSKKQLKDSTVEIVDGVLTVCSQDSVFVLFRTGVMATFTKLEKESD